MKLSQTITLALTLLVCAAWPTGVQACPFCSAVSQTLSQEIAAADVAVIAKLVKLPKESQTNGDPSVEIDLDDLDSGMAEFEILEVIRGDDGPGQGSTFKVVYFGSNQQQKLFLISGIADKEIDWATPLPLTQGGIEYIRALGSLPEEGPERLEFFLKYLENKDPLLAQDAYDEFARSPYEVLTAIGDRMDRQQLIAWIEDSQVGPTRRRLYLTLLGICGKVEDVAVLESLLQYDYQQMKPGIAAAFAVAGQTGPVVGLPILNEMIKADVRRKQRCLDALIAAYLKLKGPSGLPLIETRFLANPAVEYTHVYAAVMALRFHGEETDALPRERLLESVRLLLDNPEIADQVIPDLARWEDWTVLDRLVNLFKNSEKDAWVRQPVISYLLVATEQPAEISTRAKAALTELEELDPKGVKRARSYMAFGLLSRTGNKKKSTDASKKEKTLSLSAEPKTEKLTEKIPDQKSPSKPTKSATVEQPVKKPAAGTLSAQAEHAEKPVPPGPSRMLIIGGPLIAGLVLFGLFALLLRGGDVRSPNNDSQN